MYNVYLDDKKVKSDIKGNKVTLTNLEPEKEYSVQVTQVIDGVESDKSAAKKFTTLKKVDPESIYFAHMTHQVQKGEDFTPVPIILPLESTKKDFVVEVVSGNDLVDLKGNTITAKDVGEVELSAHVKGFDSVKTQNNLVIDIVENKVALKSFEMVLPSNNQILHNNQQYNIAAKYTPENTTELGVYTKEYDKEIFEIVDNKITVKKSGDHELTFYSKYDDTIKNTVKFTS